MSNHYLPTRTVKKPPQTNKQKSMTGSHKYWQRGGQMELSWPDDGSINGYNPLENCLALITKVELTHYLLTHQFHSYVNIQWK